MAVIISALYSSYNPEGPLQPKEEMTKLFADG